MYGNLVSNGAKAAHHWSVSLQVCSASTLETGSGMTSVCSGLLVLFTKRDRGRYLPCQLLCTVFFFLSHATVFLRRWRLTQWCAKLCVGPDDNSTAISLADFRLPLAPCVKSSWNLFVTERCVGDHSWLCLELIFPHILHHPQFAWVIQFLPGGTNLHLITERSHQRKVCFRCTLLIMFLMRTLSKKLSKDGGTPSGICWMSDVLVLFSFFWLSSLLRFQFWDVTEREAKITNNFIFLVFRITFHQKLVQSFFWRGFISVRSYSSRRSIFFLNSWTVAVFDPGRILLLNLQFFLLCEILPQAVDSQITWSQRQGSDKKEQCTGILVMEGCICFVPCGAGLGTLTFQAVTMFQTSVCWWSNMFAWTHQIGHFAWVVGLCFYRSWLRGICERILVEFS